MFTSQQQLLSLLLQQLQALKLTQQVIFLLLPFCMLSHTWQAPRAPTRIPLCCMLADLPPACCDLPKGYAAGRRRSLSP